ncbi:2315_t:CDS:2, partial [Cetraspora pellucida]
SNSLVEFKAETDLTDSEKGLYFLTKRQSFTNWKYVENELDKNNRIPRHWVYYCSKECHYKAKKKTHMLEERNKTHKNSIISKHSHPISDNIQMAAPQYHYLTSEMRDDIKLLAASSVCTGTIINMLTHKYPDQYIHAHSVYNIIQVVKAEKEKLSDADATYKELMHRKQKMPGWYVDAKFERSDNHLVELLWLHPKQIDIWCRFYNVILLNMTSLIMDKQKIRFKWILQGLLNATGGLKPKVVYIDVNLAITSAIENVWHGTKHYFCSFHIWKNFEKDFLSKFGREKFRDFFSSFCQARNSITETVYKRKWQQILDLFPETQSYLRCQLYSHHEAWVLAFTYQSFNCGIQSTQRVEVYNAILKKLLNRTTSLIEVDTPKGMFNEDLYDKTLIELTELVDGISDIKELWIVSSQFYIGILAKHWFNDRAMLKNDDYSNEHAISIQ